MTTLTLTKGLRPAGVIDTDILVVGTGPAGLATAITAARHGARVLVVERRPGTSTVPRATGVSTYAMELFLCVPRIASTADQQSCSPDAPPVMITGHMSAVRLPSHHACDHVAAAIPA